MKNIFKRNLNTPTINKPVITSKDIQEDMSKELYYILSKNNVPFISEERQKLNDFEKSNKEIIEKAESLNSLGFTNTPSVSKAIEVKKLKSSKEKEIKLNKKVSELVDKYRIEFPGYKFIPDTIYTKVMEKYNLYKSNPSRYIKEIPTKNLNEIINFKQQVGIIYELIEETVYYRSTFITKNPTRVVMCSKNRNELVEVMEEKENSFANKNYIGSSTENYIIRESQYFEITAPIDHFNLNKTKIKDRQISDMKIEAPIVTHKVDGGYIIVSVWDREAEIPEIKNEFLN